LEYPNHKENKKEAIPHPFYIFTLPPPLYGRGSSPHSLRGRETREAPPTILIRRKEILNREF
jgi:hypothetical protein